MSRYVERVSPALVSVNALYTAIRSQLDEDVGGFPQRAEHLPQAQNILLSDYLMDLCETCQDNLQVAASHERRLGELLCAEDSSMRTSMRSEDPLQPRTAGPSTMSQAVVIADDYVDYGHDPVGRGPAGARADYDHAVGLVHGVTAYDIDALVVSGDAVAVAFTGHVPDGSTFRAISLYRVRDGKITEDRTAALTAMPG